MKLLHTADWHLNLKQGKRDRTEDIRQRVRQVAEICDRERVDVLVIAGDLFSEQAEVNARVNHVAESLAHLRATFRGFFGRKGIILAVTGNHDQDGRVRPFLELARAGMDIAEPPRHRGGVFDPGKMYVLDTAFVGRVRDDREGFAVQFALLPFPSLGRVLSGDEAATTAAELNRPSGVFVENWIRSLPDSQGYDATLRTVLVAHLNVTGADVGRGMFRPGEETGVVMDAAKLPPFDYVALGHVHKPQRIRDLDHVRYSGSLDRLDHGDDDPMKEVVLVDIGPTGRRGVTPIPIQPTPMVTVTIDDPATAREHLAAAQAADPTAVVRVVVGPSAADAGGAVDLAIRDAVPNFSSVEWPSTARPDDPAARTVVEGASVRERVLDYLTRYAPDDRRESLLALATEFLDAEGHR